MHNVTWQCNELLFLINRVAFKTSIIICGCSAQLSPAVRVPPYNTTLECLRSNGGGSQSSISYSFGVHKFTCTTDSRGNPYQDCLNAMVALCSRFSPAKNSTNCIDLVRRFASQSSVSNISYWSNYSNACLLSGSSGINSVSCAQAANNLQKNAYLDAKAMGKTYEFYDGLYGINSTIFSTGYITQNITNDIKELIRNNI